MGETIKTGLSLKSAVTGVSQAAASTSEAAISFSKQSMLALVGAANRAADFAGSSFDPKLLSPKPAVMRSLEEMAHIAHAKVTGDINKGSFPQDINKSLTGIKNFVEAKGKTLADSFGFKPESLGNLSGDALVLKLAQNLDQFTRMEAAYTDVGKHSMPGTMGSLGMAAVPKSSGKSQA